MPHDLDIPTISSATFAANITLAAIMVHARATRRVYSGFDVWMASQVVMAVGMVLVSFRMYLSPWIALLGGNSLLMLAQVLVYTGVIRFFDLSNYRQWPYYGLLAIAIAIFAWLVAAGTPGSLRSILFSVFMTIMMVRIIVALIMQQKLRREPSVLLLLASVLLAMGFFATRAVILWHVGPEDAFWNRQLLAGAFYIGIVYLTLMVFGFLQLVQARTEGELQVAQARAEELANTDRLTGAWNRRRFEYEVEREMARATRHKQPLSLILFDVDHFKPINDRHGHQAGDEVLMEICKLVRHRIRSADTLIRWGGDEFLIMAPMAGAAEAETLAQALRADIASHNFELFDKITISVGVAEYRPSESLKAWLARTDCGLYVAKTQGRDQVAGDFSAATASSLYF